MFSSVPSVCTCMRLLHKAAFSWAAVCLRRHSRRQAARLCLVALLCCAMSRDPDHLPHLAILSPHKGPSATPEGHACVQGLGPAVLTPSRANGFANMLEAIKRRTRMLTSDLPTFPSLLIDASGFTAQVPAKGSPPQTAKTHLQPKAASIVSFAMLVLPGCVTLGGAAAWCCLRWRCCDSCSVTVGVCTPELVAADFSALTAPSCASVPQGDFARAQADYLQPDAEQVDGLVEVLSVKKIGLVAHFYMDPQVHCFPTCPMRDASSGERGIQGQACCCCCTLVTRSAWISINFLGGD